MVSLGQEAAVIGEPRTAGCLRQDVHLAFVSYFLAVKARQLAQVLICAQAGKNCELRNTVENDVGLASPP